MHPQVSFRDYKMTKRRIISVSLGIMIYIFNGKDCPTHLTCTLTGPSANNLKGVIPYIDMVH